DVPGRRVAAERGGGSAGPAVLPPGLAAELLFRGSAGGLTGSAGSLRGAAADDLRGRDHLTRVPLRVLGAVKEQSQRIAWQLCSPYPAELEQLILAGRSQHLQRLIDRGANQRQQLRRI